MSIQNKPLVSVIIAFLNEEQFLQEAIESVLNQEYKHWELLLVDDGSEDKSTQIALTYAERFPDKIIYCEHEGHINKGLSASRNLGIKCAHGELIAFLDADDVWLQEKLTHQVTIFQQYPEVAMVAEASKYWYSWNHLLDHSKKDIVVPVGTRHHVNSHLNKGFNPLDQDKVYDPLELNLQLYPLSNGASPCPCSLILRKKALIHIGGFEESFTRQYQLYEDLAFLSKVYLHEKVYVSSACNNFYRQRPGSIVKWVKEEGYYHTVRKYFLKWLDAYLQQHEISDKRLKKLLNKALLPYRYPALYYFSYVLPRGIWKLTKKLFPKQKIVYKEKIL